MDFSYGGWRGKGCSLGEAVNNCDQLRKHIRSICPASETPGEPLHFALHLGSDSNEVLVHTKLSFIMTPEWPNSPNIGARLGFLHFIYIPRVSSASAQSNNISEDGTSRSDR